MNEPSRRKRKPRTTGSSIGDLGIYGLDGSTRNSVGKVDGNLFDSAPFGVDESEDTLSDTTPEEVPVSVVDLSTLTFDDEDEVVYIGTKDASPDNSRTDGTMFNSSIIPDNRTDLDSSHSSFRITNSSTTNVYIKQEPISDESDFEERDVFSEQHSVDELTSSSGLVEKMYEQCSISPNGKQDLSNLGSTVSSKSCVNQGQQLETPFHLKPCFVKCEKLDINKFNLKNRKNLGSLKLQPSVRGKPSKRNSICASVKKTPKNPQPSSKITSPTSGSTRVVIHSPQKLNVIPSHESSLKKMSFVKILPSVQTHSQLQTEQLLAPSAPVQRPAYVIRSLPDLKLSLLVPVQQCASNMGIQPATSETPVYLSSPNLGPTNCTMLVNHNTQISENLTKKITPENLVIGTDHDLLSARKNQKCSTAANDDHRESSADASFPPEAELGNNFKQTTISQHKDSRTGIVEAKNLPSCNVRLVKIDESLYGEERLHNKNATVGDAKQAPSDVAEMNLPDFNVSLEETVSDNSFDSRDFMINRMVSEETDLPETSPVIVKKVELRKDLISKRLTVDLQTDQSLDVLCKDDKAPIHDSSFQLAESKKESHISTHNIHDNSEISTVNADADHMKKEIHNIEECASEKEAIDFLSNLSPSEFLRVCSAIMNNSTETSSSIIDFTENPEKKQLINLAECTSEKDAIDCLSKLSTDELLKICSGATEGIGDGMEKEERIVTSDKLGSNEEPEGTSGISKVEDRGEESDQLQENGGVTEEESDSLGDHNDNSVSELSEEDSQDNEEEMCPPAQTDLQISDEKQQADIRMKTVFEKEMWDVLFNSADTSYESDEIDVCSFSAEEGDSNIKDSCNNSNSSMHKHSGKANIKTQIPANKDKTVTARSKSRRGSRNRTSSETLTEQEVKVPKNSVKSEKGSASCSLASKKNPVSKDVCQSNLTTDSSVTIKSDVEVSPSLSSKSNPHSHWTRSSRRKGRNDLLVKEEGLCKASERKRVKDKVLGGIAECSKIVKATSEGKNPEVISHHSQENAAGESSLVTDVPVNADQGSSELSYKNKAIADVAMDESGDSPTDKSSRGMSDCSMKETITSDNSAVRDDGADSAENVIGLHPENSVLNEIPATKSENEEKIIPLQHRQGKEIDSCEENEGAQKTVVATTVPMKQEPDVSDYSDADLEVRNVEKTRMERSDTKVCVSVSDVQKEEICENNDAETGENVFPSSSTDSGITDVVLKCTNQDKTCHSLASESCDSADDIKQKDLAENRLTAGKSVAHEDGKSTNDVETGLDNVDSCDSIVHTSLQNSSEEDNILTRIENITVDGGEGVQEHDFSGEEQEFASSEFVEVSQIKEQVPSSPCKTSRRRKSYRGRYRRRKRRKSSSEGRPDEEASVVNETACDSTPSTKRESTGKISLMSDREIDPPTNVGMRERGFLDTGQFGEEKIHSDISKENDNRVTDSESEKTRENYSTRTCSFSDEAELKMSKTKVDIAIHNTLTVDKTPVMGIKRKEGTTESAFTIGNGKDSQECVTSESVENMYSSSESSSDVMNDEGNNVAHSTNIEGSGGESTQEDKATEDSTVINSKVKHQSTRHRRNSRGGHRKGRRQKSLVDEADEKTSSLNARTDGEVTHKQEDAEHEICSGSEEISLENSGSITEFAAGKVDEEHVPDPRNSLRDGEGAGDGIISKSGMVDYKISIGEHQEEVNKNQSTSPLRSRHYNSQKGPRRRKWRGISHSSVEHLSTADESSEASTGQNDDERKIHTCVDPSIAENVENIVERMADCSVADKCISSGRKKRLKKNSKRQKRVFLDEELSVINKTDTSEETDFVMARTGQNESEKDEIEESSDSPKHACGNDVKPTGQGVGSPKRCRGRPRKDSKVLQERGRRRTCKDFKKLQRSRRGRPLENFKKMLGKNLTRNMAVNGAVVMSARWALRNRGKSCSISESKRRLRSQKSHGSSVEPTDSEASGVEEIKSSRRQRDRSSESYSSSETIVEKSDNFEEHLKENPCETIAESNSSRSTDITGEQMNNFVSKVDNEQPKSPDVSNKMGGGGRDSEEQEVVDNENEFNSTEHQEINSDNRKRNDSDDNQKKTSECSSHSESNNENKPKDMSYTSGEKTVSPLKLIKRRAREGLRSRGEPAYRVELSPEEAAENIVDQKSSSVRRNRKRCKSRNRGKQLDMELTPPSEKPPLCLSSENEKHAEADVSLPTETDDTSEIIVDDFVKTGNKEIGESVSEENMLETSQESSVVTMEVSSSSLKNESQENLTKDNIPEEGEQSSEVTGEANAKRSKRKRSSTDDKVSNAGETSEAVLDVSSDSSKSKRRRSTGEDEVPSKDISSELNLPNPPVSTTPKTDGQPVSELNSKESATVKSESSSEPVRYSSSGRKICRKSFSDELYTTPDLALKFSTPKEEKKPVQLSSSGRKISKKSFGDDVHTPPIAAISPSTPKSVKSERKKADGDFIKPFTMGWMREVVYRATSDTPQVGKRKADIYYFSPEGTKLRSMPEIGAYLGKNKVTNLDLSNFTFLKETIYREPFEKERAAKIKTASAATNSSAVKPKKEVTSDVKPGSVTVEKRVPKIKLPFTFPSPVKNSTKTPNTKEEKPKELKKSANKQTVSNQNITPKRKKNELAGEKRKLDLNPLLVSTKKLLQPQNWETDTVRRCSQQCPDTNSEEPSLQCKKCLCLFHPRCVSIKLKKYHKYDFLCRPCSSGFDGSGHSNRQEMGDSNHVTEKTANANSCEEVSEINLVPEVLLEQNPHDPPIRQLEWKNKTQPSVAPLNRPYGGPPPLKRAPDANLKNKVENAVQNIPGHETSNSVSRNNPAIVSALGPGAKLPPLLPGSFILRNRLTQNKRPSSSSPPISHTVNIPSDTSLANTQSGASFYQFTGTSQAAVATIPSPAVSASTTPMPPPGKNVRAPRFILPAPATSTSSALLQGQTPTGAVQQVKVTPYSSTIVVAQSSSYTLNKNSTVLTYTKVDSVSPGVNAADKTSRQPLKMCDFNIVPASSSNQVSPPSVVGFSALNDASAQPSESVNVVNSHVSRPNQQKNEKQRNSSPAARQKVMGDVHTPTKNVNFQLVAKFSDMVESHGDSSSEEFSPVRNSLDARKAGEGSQKLWTDHVIANEEELGNSPCVTEPFGTSSKKNTVISSMFGINKLMWGFDALNLIFEKLPVNDLLRASQVCRSWRNLASQHFLWKNISLRDLKIRNWKRCANALRRYRTSSLDLRGLQHISDSDNTWNEFIGIIKFLKHLEKIVFGQVPPSVIVMLSEFLTQLRSLECYCLTEVCDEPDLWDSMCTFDFGCIKNLRQLERLRIRSANELKVSSDVLASALCDLPALQHLSLTSFTTLQGSDFGFLRNLKNLLSLELGDTKNWECENFIVLAELPNLQALRLDNGGSVSDTGLAEAIMKMKDLQELRLINYKIPSNLGSALKKARSLRRLSIWPDNSSEAALVNYNALEAVSKVKKLTYFCWGILIADGNQDLTDGCRPLVDVLKHGSSDTKVADDVLHLSSVDLLERLYYLLPNVEVQVECIHRSKFNKYWTVHK